jgi:hypothetical protein
VPEPRPVDVAPASQSIHPTHLPARLAIARRSVEISSATALSPFAIIKAEENVIKLSVLYPNTAGCKFDIEYYRTRRMPMAQQKLGPACRRMAVEEGIAGGAPGAPATSKGEAELQRCLMPLEILEIEGSRIVHRSPCDLDIPCKQYPRALRQLGIYCWPNKKAVAREVVEA